MTNASDSSGFSAIFDSSPFFQVEKPDCMKDLDKSKEELVSELDALRQRVAELEQLVGDRHHVETAHQEIKADLEQKIAEHTDAIKASNDQLVAEIAERHQVEEALRAAKDQLQAILDAVPGIVSWISSDLRYLGVNRHLADMYGLPPHTFAGKDIGFLHSSTEFRDFVQEFFQRPQKDDFQEVSSIVKGVMRYYLIVVQKYDQDRAAFAVGIDITDRHRAEEALKQAESKYRSIFENATEGIFQTSPEGYYISANPALARIYGYESPEELINNLTSVQQQLYVSPNRRAEFIQLLQEHDSVIGFESQIYRKDGSLIWISENARAVRDAYSNLLYYEGSVEDISERKKAQEALKRLNEELESRVDERTAALKELNRRLMVEVAERQRIETALRQSEAELRALFAAMTDVITVFDTQGRYIKTIATNYELLFKPDIERVGKTVYDILPLDLANRVVSHIQQALKTGETVTLEYSLPVSHSDSLSAREHSLDAFLDPAQERWFVANVSPLLDDSVIWVARDITKRKQAEEALRQAEEKYRSIFENAAEGIFQTTPEGTHLSANPALVRMYGYSSEEELIASMTDIQHQLYVDPNRRAEFVAALEEKDYVSDFESQIYRKDGSIIWTSENARAVRDASGMLLYYEGTVEDITKRKQAEEAQRQSEAKEREKSQQLERALKELQTTQAQLVQSEKMSSLGQLVAGVAHEINNPVNFIYGNLVYATRYTKDLLELLQTYQRAIPEPAPELHERIAAVDLDFILVDLPKLMASMRVGAERIREIVRSLQTFSRLDEAELKAVEIHDGIDSTLMILQHRLRESDRPAIIVTKEYGTLPAIRCYAGQLNQVFMNILSNAIDALDAEVRRQHHVAQAQELDTATVQCAVMPFMPTIHIRTETVDENWIAITIADNGPGMGEEVLRRVFDPFFTTKEVGKGTGLGMSISHQIVVERHKGQIYCLSTPGKGAEFVIKLPISQGEAD